MALPDKDTMAAIAVTRFGLGARPGEIEAAKSDPRAWLKSQITSGPADQPAGNLPDSAHRVVANHDAMADRMASRARATSPTVSAPPPSPMMAAGDAAGLQEEFMARAQLAASSGAAFRERWAMFWSNHFTVSAAKGELRPLPGPFEREAIRPRVFGRFENLALASSRHPGMLFYLDQAQSVGPDSQIARSPGSDQRESIDGAKLGLNENFARELMELHTVGVDGGYHQVDVTELARAMTGWSVGGVQDGGMAGRYMFRSTAHEPGERTVMGKHYRDTGETQAVSIMVDLANHPATARRLARKLVIHFVSDDPSPALVSKLEAVLVSSKGDLGQVAAVLIDADEAWALQPAKFKTPYEFIISAHRALGSAPTDASTLIQPLAGLGQPAFAAPSPKGWPEQAANWASPDGLIKRLAWSETFAEQTAPGPREPIKIAQEALGARLTAPTSTAILAAESRPQALAILFMSPEFQRR
ncbi:MAG: DUF1800 family protein [Alphaproteobacteria bacterium]